jgi:hypothetical protein
MNNHLVNNERNVLICTKDKMYLLERPASIQWKEIKPLPGDAGFTRTIDKHIHVDYWKNVERLLENDRINAYFKAQQKLIELVSGCEKAIFNDPTTNYPFRHSFRGVTGTMTNILTGGFFHLYLHVLKIPDITVNICTDLVTMFDHLTKYAHFDYMFQISPVDFEAIKEIISILMMRKKTVPHMKDLFTPTWFDAFEKLIKDVHTHLIGRGTDTFYWKNPTFSNLRGGRLFEPGLKALFPRECKLEWRDDSIVGDYNDRPYYLRRDADGGKPEVNTGRDQEISPDTIHFLKEVRKLFILDEMAGGRRRKTRRNVKRKYNRSLKQRR